MLGVIELASLTPFTEVHLAFLDQLMELIGVSLNAILASSRTEELLAESQRLASRAAGEAGRAAVAAGGAGGAGRAALAVQPLQVRVPGQHEPRAAHPAEQPADPGPAAHREPDGNLTDKQVEFARTIHSSGTDLLQLINDILDLSKVEAGKMDVHVGEVVADPASSTTSRRRSGRSPRTGARVRADGAPASCRETVHTDEHRLQQILRNLVSNAVKFTEHGTVRLVVEPATKAQVSRSTLAGRDVIAFSVIDTGIGIAEREAAGHLRGVPAGRRHHEPAVRRHRPRPEHQPGDRAPARW